MTLFTCLYQCPLNYIIGNNYSLASIVYHGASDTFAYFAGRAFGKHKIVPSISPNKTLEGFIGGFIMCLLQVLYFRISWVFHGGWVFMLV